MKALPLDGAANLAPAHTNGKLDKFKSRRDAKHAKFGEIENYFSLRSWRLCARMSSLAYLNGAQGAGVMIVFSCITRNSLVGGGQPSAVLLASARSRSRSPASL